VNDLERTAQRLTYQLLEHRWSGAAYLVAPETALAQLHGAVRAAWAAMLSAFSSGIAHADQDDPKVPENEKRLAELKRVVILAPGLAIPSGQQVIAFVATDAPTPEGALRVNA
jgi:hypothetical protein